MSGGAEPSGAFREFSGAVQPRRPSQREKLPPCRVNCPIGVDVRGWIGLVAQREKLGLSFEEACTRAWTLIVERNPFPATMGRVCPHLCEQECNRKDKDGSLAVGAMERFIGDWALHARLALPQLDEGPYPESIGVVGAGPAGLSFAYQMARRQYPVTLYEREARAGGMLAHSIPSYRLPDRILDAEVRRIVDLGVDLRLRTKVGRDVAFEELRSRHAVLFLGVGAQKARLLGIPGDEGRGVWTGTELLKLVKLGRKVALGKRVVVVGGGNTAIDAARTARRAQAEVTLLYRRTRSEMPAVDAEVEEALKENVCLEFLVAPLEIRRTRGGVTAIVVQRMQLEEADASGRPRPVPLAGSEFELPVDSVIAAVSQEPDLDGFASLASAERWVRADRAGRVSDGLWAGGDAVGLGLASRAISHGRVTAEAVHAKLRSLEPLPAEQVGPDGEAAAKLDYYEHRSRATPPETCVEERLACPDLEVNGTISRREFLDEASRCLSCGSCFGCEQCFMYCNPAAFVHLDDVSRGSYFALSLELCEGCGKCIDVCPCEFLSLATLNEHKPLART